MIDTTAGQLNCPQMLTSAKAREVIHNYNLFKGKNPQTKLQVVLVKRFRPSPIHHIPEQISINHLESHDQVSNFKKYMYKYWRCTPCTETYSIIYHACCFIKLLMQNDGCGKSWVSGATGWNNYSRTEQKMQVGLIT